jgi:hypothetical protein
MTWFELVLDGVTLTAAAVVLCAGAGKLAVPWPAARAVRAVRVLPASEAAATVVVRSVALAEIMIATAVPVRSTRVPAAIALGALGLTFVGFGLALRLRRGAVSCGCFGRDTGHPAGWRNVVGGVGLVGVATANVASAGAGGLDDANAFMVVAGLTVAVCGWIYRRLLRDLTASMRFFGRDEVGG